MVADDKMAAFHGAGLRRYLLTVMAAAAKAFKHPSIRNPVNLVVTRLVILGPGEEGPQVGPSAAQTLRSFCTWQQGLNAPQDSDPDHFDTAVLFTRQVSPPAPQTARATPGTPPPRAAARTRPRWPPLPPGPEEAQHPACSVPARRALGPGSSCASRHRSTGPVRGLHLRHPGHGRRGHCVRPGSELRCRGGRRAAVGLHCCSRTG